VEEFPTQIGAALNLTITREEIRVQLVALLEFLGESSEEERKLLLYDILSANRGRGKVFPPGDFCLSRDGVFVQVGCVRGAVGEEAKEKGYAQCELVWVAAISN
jgi:hypothetical protein